VAVPPFLAALVAAAGVAALVAGTMTPLLAAWARRRNYLDIPNHRSSHVIATPRIGGVALAMSALLGVIILHTWTGGLSREVAIVFGGGLAIAVLGLADDLWHLSALVRLAVQTVVAGAVVMAVGSAALFDGIVFWGVFVATLMWLVALTNAYNFMDGIDGIAGAHAVVAGMGWAAVGLVGGVHQLTALGLLIATATGGFLVHNWHPARVFMGDAGSGFLGFMFAALPLTVPAGHGSLWLCAVLLMWPFLMDSGFTLIRRVRLGENVLSAHRSHVYQRLVLTGRSHSQVARIYAGLALLGVMAAVAVEMRQSVAQLVSALIVAVAAGAVWSHLIGRERASRGRSTRAAV
jgi:UDP-N-acetylmuramyl pentapeptide phosphotransferase/UDP-N-acetylglucosamine-1-phosphate transferase